MEKNSFERSCSLEDVYINTKNITHASPWTPDGFTHNLIREKIFSRLTLDSGRDFIVEGSIDSISEKINLEKKGLICG